MVLVVDITLTIFGQPHNYMANTTEIVKNDFSGGKAQDIYNSSNSQYDRIFNLDTTQDGRMRSQRDLVDDTPSTPLVTETGALMEISTGKLLGLGRAPTTQYARIVNKSSPTGSWTTATNGTTSSGSVTYEMFFEHQGYVYFWTSTGVISRWKVDGSSMTTAWATISGLAAFGAGPGYRWNKNDQAYFAWDNFLYGINVSTDAPALKLTVPSEYKIVSITDWENYLVLGLTHKSKFNDSKVFFYDGLAADPTFVKNIPDGRLVSVRNSGSEVTAISTYSKSQGSSLVTDKTMLLISTYNGTDFISRIEQVMSYNDEDFSITERCAVVKNSYVYFGAASADADIFTGIYRFGLSKNRYILTEDRNANSDSSVVPYSILDLEFYGDVLFTTYQDDAFTSFVDHTNTNRVYSDLVKEYWSSSIIQGKRGQSKKLKCVSVITAPLLYEPVYTDPQVVAVYFRIDNETNWTLLGKHNAALYSETQITQENTANPFPSRFNNIQFKLAITGLVQVIEWDTQWEEIISDLHEVDF